MLTILPPDMHELANIAQQDLVARLKKSLWAACPEQMDMSPTRITGYLEEGLALLYSLAERNELPASEVEECRRLAEQDARYQFVYRLPMSAGFGAAIGRVLQCALNRLQDEPTRETTALLNVFMTALDGVLDEAPETIEPHWDLLLQAGQGWQPEHSYTINDPVLTLCFRVANLWRGRITHASGNLHNGLMATFNNAVRESMAAEYQTSKSSFHAGVPESDKHLFNRTRWPHWTQAVACLLLNGVPKDLDLEAYQQMIFKIGDYAAILDDICDYVEDCIAKRWNTVLYAIARENNYHQEDAISAQKQFLVALANDGIANKILGMALTIRGDLETSIDATGLSRDDLMPLIADLTYAYVGFDQ